jgi:hypothetical protein
MGTAKKALHRFRPRRVIEHSWRVRSRMAAGRDAVIGPLVGWVVTVVPGTQQALMVWLAMLDAAGFIINWALVWGLFVWLIPDLFVGSINGLTVLFQVLPPTIVAVYVLVLGSLFVVTQIMVQTYGQRSTLLLTEDPFVIQTVLRPLLIAVAALLLAGQVPDAGSPSNTLTAAAETLAVATIFTSLRTAYLLVVVAIRYTAPISVASRATENVDAYLAVAETGQVRWRISMLEEVAKLALRRGDSAALGAALQGILRFVTSYVEAAIHNPAARGHLLQEDGIEFALYGWGGEDAAQALQRIGDDAFRQQAPSSDTDAPVTTLEHAAQYAVHHGLLFESERMTRALMMLGCSAHQVTAGFENLLSRPTGSLARLEAAYENAGATYFAAYALAGWMLCVSYFDGHIVNRPDEPLGQHPLWDSSIASFGPHPPWMAASEIIKSTRWQQNWANQIKVDLNFVLIHIGLAQVDYNMPAANRPGQTHPSYNQIMQGMQANPGQQPR